LELYTNFGVFARTFILHPVLIKKVGAAFAETKKLWCTEGVWWRRYTKNEIERKS